MSAAPLVPMAGRRPGRHYRLPSGVIIDDHVDWHRLRTHHVADYLGTQLAAEAGLVDLEDVQIVGWDYVRDLAESVSDRIHSRHRVLGLSREDLDFRYGAFSPIAPGQLVVLLIGSVLTGRTATTLLRVLRRMEAQTLAVATVIDGRTSHGAPIETLSGPIPVVACLHQALVADTPPPLGDDVIDIDAAGNEVCEVPDPGLPISANEFQSWLRQCPDSGVYMGHIERRRAGSGIHYRRARHFSTYVNMGQLIGNHEGPIHAVAVNVRNALGEHLTRGDLIVFHPATQGDIARELANGVAGKLRAYLHREIPVVPASRGPGGSWRLKLGPWPSFTAVIIDWGAVTTATIRALMALALQHGATRIHAVVLTSQMSEAAERDLTSMAVMRGVRLTALGERPEHVMVPVSASFLARVPMGMSTISDCHLCHLAHEFRRQAETAPTELLREHARRKFELYRPRGRPSGVSSVATDMVGAVLQPGEAVRVWEVHHLLERARTSPRERRVVRESVLALAAKGCDNASFLAWLRLLVVEPYWLNYAPLSANDTRSALAQACAAELTDASDDPDISAKWQAAIVLRVASKRAFLDSFPTVLASVSSDPTVAAEVCYGMYSLVERPYNHWSPILDDALDAVREARTQIVDRHASGELRDVRMTLDAIHRRANVTHRRTSQSRADPLASWNALQRSYVEPMKNHDGVLTNMLVVLNALSGPSARQAAEAGRDGGYHPPEYWLAVVEAWSDCWDFIGGAVFPHLPALKDLLMAPNPRLADGPAQLLDFDQERAASLGRRLRMLESYPSWFSPSVRLELEVEARAWFEGFLSAPVRQRDDPRDSSLAGAVLFRVLAENPCDLADAWEAACVRARGVGLKFAEASEIPTGLLIFARRTLLTDVLGQILENAARTHTLDDAPSRGVDVELRVAQNAEVVLVHIRNNWSRASRVGVGGLGHFREELALFGAELKQADLAAVGAGDASGWSYEVTLSLRRWRERE